MPPRSAVDRTNNSDCHERLVVEVELLRLGSILVDAVAQPMNLIPVCKVEPTSSLGVERSFLPLSLHSLMQLLLPTQPSRRNSDSRKVCLVPSVHRNTRSSNTFPSLDLLDSTYISSPCRKVAEIDTKSSWRKVKRVFSEGILRQDSCLKVAE